ncbi:MAG: 30S ribosomal protein S17 [Kiritimatiellaeota bacterium]|nr:30S ribosomal protein S17 [Kiritimatiellota bacterium]
MANETKEQTVRGHRKERTGTVVRDKQDKTIIVEVERRVAHPLYKKVVKTNDRYTAHDQANEAKIGDKVKITETRPLSKTKRWRLTGIISRVE